jgi:hypothetical protein
MACLARQMRGFSFVKIVLLVILSSPGGIAPIIL